MKSAGGGDYALVTRLCHAKRKVSYGFLTTFKVSPLLPFHPSLSPVGNIHQLK